MIIPYQSDAPLHYFPWATLSLITLSTLVFFSWCCGGITDSAYSEWWVLHYDGDFHLLQILTSAFAHASFGHLLGNMIFLWAFGVIVEGKLGWWRFVPLYLGMAVVVAVLELVFCFGSGRGSLGASSVIMGLMMCALFWAPLNRMDCAIIWFPFVRFFELSVKAVCGFYLAWELLWLFLDGFAMGTALLHVFGLIVGFFPAYFFLRKQLVDCEGWDLLTIWQRGSPDVSRRWGDVQREQEAATAEAAIDIDLEWQRCLDLFHAYIAEAEPTVADKVYRHFCMTYEVRQLSDQDQLDLIQAYLKQEMTADALALMKRFHQQHPQHVGITLQLAALYINKQERPAHGLSFLAGLAAIALSTKQQQSLQDLRVQAEAMIKNGVLELD